MAAVTPTTVTRESMGSLTLHIATFTSIDSSTWASGLPNAVAYWSNQLTPAMGSIGITATSTGSTGTTFDIVSRLAAGACKIYVASYS
jgi:hypothetical protein